MCVGRNNIVVLYTQCLISINELDTCENNADLVEFTQRMHHEITGDVTKTIGAQKHAVLSHTTAWFCHGP